MSDITRDTVVCFLQERGGRVPNQQLVEHFRPRLTGESRAATRQSFKDIVNEVASVRVEEGAKYVCLRKRYRRAKPDTGQECLTCPGENGENGTERDQRNGEITGEPRDDSTGGDPRDDSTGGEPRDDSTGGDPRDDSTGGEPRDDSTRGDLRDDSTGGEPRNGDPGDGDSGEDEAGASEKAENSADPGIRCTGEEEASESSPEESSEAGSPDSPQFGGPDSPQSGGPDASPPAVSVTEEAPPVRMGGRTPRSSRRGGRDLLRAGEADRSSLHSSSSVSGNEEEEAGGGPVSLEPLEHAWMLSACRARWEPLQELLMADPGLLTRRDFITGFSCLHWAAKHGEHELLAALLSHARQHRLPVNINARASGGYTALHLAAMHGHLDAMKLLVGACDADLDIRDYSGRKAWQYLSPDTARDVLALVGAAPGEEGEEGGMPDTGRWRLSRVLPTQLIVHRLSQLPEDEPDATSRNISRKGSGGKPRLNKIRFRTQIIHTNLANREDDEMSAHRSPMRHRPKSNVFG